MAVYGGTRHIAKALIAAELESARGTYETIDTGDIILAHDIELPAWDANMYQYNIGATGATKTRHANSYIMGEVVAPIRFKSFLPLDHQTNSFAVLCGTGVTSDLFKACHTVSALSAGTSYTMTADDDAASCVSLSINIDGMEWRFRGCAGNVEFHFEAGAPAYLQWDMLGVLSASAESAVLSGTAYAPTPETVESFGTFTLNDGTVTMYSSVKEIVLSTGNVLTKRMDCMSAKGVAYIDAASRLPTLKYTISPPKDATTAVYDAELMAAYVDDTACNIVFYVTASGGATADTLDIGFTGIHTALNLVNDNGFLLYNGELAGYSVTAEAEWSATFYISA